MQDVQVQSSLEKADQTIVSLQDDIADLSRQLGEKEERQMELEKILLVWGTQINLLRACLRVCNINCPTDTLTMIGQEVGIGESDYLPAPVVGLDIVWKKSKDAPKQTKTIDKEKSSDSKETSNADASHSSFDNLAKAAVGESAIDSAAKITMLHTQLTALSVDAELLEDTLAEMERCREDEEREWSRERQSWMREREEIEQEWKEVESEHHKVAKRELELANREKELDFEVEKKVNALLKKRQAEEEARKQREERKRIREERKARRKEMREMKRRVNEEKRARGEDVSDLEEESEEDSIDREEQLDRQNEFLDEINSLCESVKMSLQVERERDAIKERESDRREKELDEELTKIQETAAAERKDRIDRMVRDDLISDKSFPADEKDSKSDSPDGFASSIQPSVPSTVSPSSHLAHSMYSSAALSPLEFSPHHETRLSYTTSQLKEVVTHTVGILMKEEDGRRKKEERRKRVVERREKERMKRLDEEERRLRKEAEEKRDKERKKEKEEDEKMMALLKNERKYFQNLYEQEKKESEAILRSRDALCAAKDVEITSLKKEVIQKEEEFKRKQAELLHSFAEKKWDNFDLETQLFSSISSSLSSILQFCSEINDVQILGRILERIRRTVKSEFSRRNQISHASASSSLSTVPSTKAPSTEHDSTI
ncbi:hypothetical protein ADUPG1_012066, partial [Aduncisulcus paluster]